MNMKKKSLEYSTKVFVWFSSSSYGVPYCVPTYYYDAKTR